MLADATATTKQLPLLGLSVRVERTRNHAREGSFGVAAIIRPWALPWDDTTTSVLVCWKKLTIQAFLLILGRTGPGGAECGSRNKARPPNTTALIAPSHFQRSTRKRYVSRKGAPRLKPLMDCKGPYFARKNRANVLYALPSYNHTLPSNAPLPECNATNESSGSWRFPTTCTCTNGT